MIRNYECMVLLDNREVKKGWQATKDAVSAMVTKHGGEIVAAKLWDERRLAYPIKHQERATYLLVFFKGDSDVANGARREMELSEFVLRQLFLVIDEFPEDIDAPEAEFDESKLQTKDTADQPDSIREAAAEEAEAEAEAKAEGEAEKADEKKDDEKATAGATAGEGASDSDAKKEDN